MGSIDCLSFEGALLELEGGESTKVSREDLVGHLSSCSACARFLVDEVETTGVFTGVRFPNLWKLPLEGNPDFKQMRPRYLRRAITSLRFVSAGAGGVLLLLAVVGTWRALSSGSGTPVSPHLDLMVFRFCLGVAILLGSFENESLWYTRWIVISTGVLLFLVALFDFALGAGSLSGLLPNFPIMLASLCSAVMLLLLKPGFALTTKKSVKPSRSFSMIRIIRIATIGIAGIVMSMALTAVPNRPTAPVDPVLLKASVPATAVSVSYLGRVVPPCDATLNRYQLPTEVGNPVKPA